MDDKIYRVAVVVKNEHTSYIKARSKEEAEQIAQTLYSEEGPLEYEWGAEELSSEIYADDKPLEGIQLEPDYRGDALKIAETNAEAYMELATQRESELVYNNDVCPSSLMEDERTGKLRPITEGDTAHKMDEETGECNECGAKCDALVPCAKHKDFESTCLNCNDNNPLKN